MRHIEASTHRVRHFQRARVPHSSTISSQSDSPETPRIERDEGIESIRVFWRRRGIERRIVPICRRPANNARIDKPDGAPGEDACDTLDRVRVHGIAVRERELGIPAGRLEGLLELLCEGEGRARGDDAEDPVRTTRDITERGILHARLLRPFYSRGRAALERRQDGAAGLGEPASNSCADGSWGDDCNCRRR